MLKKFIQRWKQFGRKAGDFQARLLLSFFYFVVLAPFAFIVRMSSDPLALKAGTHEGWRLRTQSPETPSEAAKKQY